MLEPGSDSIRTDEAPGDGSMVRFASLTVPVQRSGVLCVKTGVRDAHALAAKR